MPDIMVAKQAKDFTVMNKEKNFHLSVLCLLLMTFLQCKKANTVDNTTDFFPPVQFKTQLNLNLPLYIPLTFPQGYVYIPEGNKGTVVIHLAQGGYVAYDRTCSFQPTDACAQVVVDSNYANIKCGSYKANTKPSFTPCCGSTFDLNTGIATTKPAQIPLRQYYTSYDDAQKILWISNAPF